MHFTHHRNISRFFSLARIDRRPDDSHKEERKRDEIVSRLTPWILYDIGESDCRPRRSKSDVWDSNPYRLLIDAIMSRSPSEFDPRR
jgi:hypothetical protein